MIIFGIKARFTKVKPLDVLSGSCPECKGDLYLENLKKWFTLYFIPVFPYEKLDTVYKCAGCGNTFKQAIKGMLAESKEAGKKAKKVFAEAAAAALTYLSRIDSGMNKEAKEVLDELAKTMPEYRQDIAKTMEKTGKDEEAILEKLTVARNSLSNEGALILAAQIARVVKAGKPGAKRDDIVKKYILALGITREMFGKLLGTAAKELPEKPQ